MFGMADSGGISIEDLLAATVSSINAWTTEAIKEALIMSLPNSCLVVEYQQTLVQTEDLQNSIIQVTTNIQLFKENIALFNALTDPSATIQEQLAHFNQGLAKLTDLFGIGKFLCP